MTEGQLDAQAVAAPASIQCDEAFCGGEVTFCADVVPHVESGGPLLISSFATAAAAAAVEAGSDGAPYGPRHTPNMLSWLANGLLRRWGPAQSAQNRLATHHGGQGESPVPPPTRGSVSLPLVTGWHSIQDTWVGKCVEGHFEEFLRFRRAVCAGADPPTVSRSPGRWTTPPGRVTSSPSPWSTRLGGAG